MPPTPTDLPRCVEHLTYPIERATLIVRRTAPSPLAWDHSITRREGRLRIVAV